MRQPVGCVQAVARPAKPREGGRGSSWRQLGRGAASLNRASEKQQAQQPCSLPSRSAGSYHNNPLNQLIHFIFVPAILWTVAVWLAYTPPLLRLDAAALLPAACAPYARWVQGSSRCSCGRWCQRALPLLRAGSPVAFFWTPGALGSGGAGRGRVKGQAR